MGVHYWRMFCVFTGCWCPGGTRNKIHEQNQEQSSRSCVQGSVKRRKVNDTLQLHSYREDYLFVFTLTSLISTLNFIGHIKEFTAVKYFNSGLKTLLHFFRRFKRDINLCMRLNIEIIVNSLKPLGTWKAQWVEFNFEITLPGPFFEKKP